MPVRHERSEGDQADLFGASRPGGLVRRARFNVGGEL